MRLLGIIVEGQFYLVGVLAIFVAELGVLLWGLWSRRPLIALVAVFAVVPLLRSTLSAVRAVLFRSGPPDGVPLDRSAAPSLYALVDEIRRVVSAPAVHRIAITSDFNAGAATHRPPWRLRRRRVLVLGLPVLATLSAAELRAVIAHELAHFSAAHDPFSAWVYRTRASWFALRQSLDRRLATPLYVYWLIRWYVPRLNAAAANVIRRHELAADRVAASVAGSRATADALVVLEAGARFAADTYWPMIRTSYETEEAPPRPYTRMLEWDARISTADALNDLRSIEPPAWDTHPSLRERCARLGEDIRVPPITARPSGADILGPALAALARRLDQIWIAANQEAWQARRAALVEQRTALARLADIVSPTADDEFRRAELVESLQNADEALPLYRRAALQGHAAATLALGRLLLGRMDPSGVALIEEAMTRDEDLVPAGCGVLAGYYTKRHEDLLARKCEWRAARHATDAHLASR
jgi:Zn-dependent protease with chaperone function